MTERTLPHVPYIEAISDAFTEAGMKPAEVDVRDDETRGTHCYLDAVMTLDPSGTHDLADEEIPAGTRWPHGLLLIWEWHTGRDDYEPERGPAWRFAELKADGSCEYPTDLPVYGYASPAAVIEAARLVIDRRIGAGHFHNFGRANWDGGIVGDSWERADELEAACSAWDAEE